MTILSGGTHFLAKDRKADAAFGVFEVSVRYALRLTDSGFKEKVLII